MDYFGGTRTVDVHVRRLRAKLGPEHEQPDRHRAQRGLPVRAADVQENRLGARLRRRGPRRPRVRGRPVHPERRPVASSMTDRLADGAATVALSSTRTLTTQEAADVRAAAAAARASDGVDPLDDQVRTEARVRRRPRQPCTSSAGPAGDPPVIAYATRRDGTRTARAATWWSTLTTAGTGIGETMVDHLLGLLRGDGPSLAASASASRCGPTATPMARRRWPPRAVSFAIRDLWQMRRALASPLPEPTYPEDVSVRTFEPGRDDEAWVALNAAAFAHHPEQGRLTVDDLRHRDRGAMVRPRGVLPRGTRRSARRLALDEGPPRRGDRARTSVGEVYASASTRAAQGLGLGKALTLTGCITCATRGWTT